MGNSTGKRTSGTGSRGILIRRRIVTLLLALALFDFGGAGLIFLLTPSSTIGSSSTHTPSSTNSASPPSSISSTSTPSSTTSSNTTSSTDSPGSTAPTPNSGSPSLDVSRSVAAEEERIETIVSGMSLRELIGQRFIIYVPGRSVTDWLHTRIEKGRPAGYIIYPWNYETREELHRLTGELNRLTSESSHGIAPIISADQEGGRVSALRFASFVSLPSAFDIGSFRDSRFARAAGYITGQQLQEVGINMNLAPVVDVYEASDSSIIGDRAYSADPEVASTMGVAFMQGLHRAGVMAVAKHFPGHGVSATDSHHALPISEISPQTLRRTHIPPFTAMIQAGVDAVMPAHILYSSIDESLPATLSPTIMRDILREELDYDGVVVSDGLEMGALTNHFSKREILSYTLTNGTDLLLLMSEFDLLEMIEISESLVQEGVVTVADLRESVRRILELKARYGLLSEARVEEFAAAVHL